MRVLVVRAMRVRAMWVRVHMCGCDEEPESYTHIPPCSCSTGHILYAHMPSAFAFALASNTYLYSIRISLGAT